MTVRHVTTGGGWSARWAGGLPGCMDRRSPDYNPNATIQPNDARCWALPKRGVCFFFVIFVRFFFALLNSRV